MALTHEEYVALYPFKAWVQQNLPAIYDDSLSYTDLLAKLLYYVNNLTDNDNMLQKDMKKLFDYINNYFLNLDVQQNVDKKLDEMAKNGTLDKIFGVQFSGYLTPEMFGAKCNGIDDDAPYILQCYENCLSKHKIMLLPNKYYIKSNIEFSKGGLTIIGNNPSNTLVTNVQTFDDILGGLYFDNCSLRLSKISGCTFIGVAFIGNGYNKSYKTDLIKLDTFYTTFDSCYFNQFNHAIIIGKNDENWGCENRINNCVFKVGNIGIYSYAADCYLTQNIFARCEQAISNEFAGWNISNNHFYNDSKNTIKCFNTLIQGNYIQECVNGSTTFECSNVSVSFIGNKFELLDKHTLPEETGLINSNVYASEIYVMDNVVFEKLAYQVSENLYLVKPISNTSIIFRNNQINGLSGLKTNGNGYIGYVSNRAEDDSFGFLKAPAKGKYLTFSNDSGLQLDVIDYTGTVLTYGDVLNTIQGICIALYTQSGVDKMKLFVNEKVTFTTYSDIQNLKLVFIGSELAPREVSI